MISNQNLDDNIKRVPPTYSGSEAEDALANSLEGSFRVEVSTGINNELFLALGSAVGYAMIMQFVPEEGGRVQVAVGPDGRTASRMMSSSGWSNWMGTGFFNKRNVTEEFLNSTDVPYPWMGLISAETAVNTGLNASGVGIWWVVLSILNVDSQFSPQGKNGFRNQLAFALDANENTNRPRICIRTQGNVTQNYGWGPWRTLIEDVRPIVKGPVKFKSENRTYEFLRFFECGGPQSQYGWPGCHVQLVAGQALILGAGECSNGWWELMKERTEGTADSETVWIVSDRAIRFFYNQADKVDESKSLDITVDGHLLLPITPTHSRGAVPKSYVDALEARVKALEDKLK